MAVPVLVIAGFLGSGKTTLLNRLLTDPGGKRIAAVVNDFGAIDIDATLLGAIAEDVVSLKNGCICCTLQGDLLRTLASVMRRAAAPDLIVIETSGISDPSEIVRALLDPVIFKVAALDTVITLVDAGDIAAHGDRLDDPLWRSQITAADFVILNKIDLVDPEVRARLHGRLARWKPSRSIFETVHSNVPSELLLCAGDGYQPVPPGTRASKLSAPRYDSVSWTSATSWSLSAFQAVVAQLAQTTLRAKGILTFREKPTQPMQFQLVGSRATIIPCGVRPANAAAVNLVIIFDTLENDRADILRLLEGFAEPS